ncbi:39S ribosomal protein L44, mitochondrial [Rhizina undulata]
MITRYLKNVTVHFNPFSPRARTARLFMSLLPPDARQSMRINTKILGQDSKEAGWVEVVFKDGKEIKLDVSKMSIKDLVEEMDRHSRMLKRQDELAG